MKTHIWFLSFGWGVLLSSVIELNAVGSIRSVTRTDQPNLAGGGGSFTPTFSADGRAIVFLSHARNLVTNDNLAAFLNVYIRDLTASNTTLVSVNQMGV